MNVVTSIRWRPQLLVGVLAVAMVLACTTPPQKVGFERNPDGTIKATAEWDGINITIQGLENALADAMGKLQEAQASGNDAHAQAWQDIINRILELKSESMQAVPAPDPEPVPGLRNALVSTQPAYIKRPTLRAAMNAYLAYEDGFIADVQAALAVGVSEADLEGVKTALLY